MQEFIPCWIIHFSTDHFFCIHLLQGSPSCVKCVWKKIKYSTHQSSKHSHGFAGFSLYNLNTLPPPPPLLPQPPRSTPPISYCFLFHLQPHPRFNNLIFFIFWLEKNPTGFIQICQSHIFDTCIPITGERSGPKPLAMPKPLRHNNHTNHVE